MVLYRVLEATRAVMDQQIKEKSLHHDGHMMTAASPHASHPPS